MYGYIHRSYSKVLVLMMFLLIALVCITCVVQVFNNKQESKRPLPQTLMVSRIVDWKVLVEGKYKLDTSYLLMYKDGGGIEEVNKSEYKLFKVGDTLIRNLKNIK